MQLPAEASSSSTNQPDIPRNEEPMIVDSPTLPTLPTTPERPRPATEKEVFLRATDKTTIWSTHYLDPCLHSSFVNVPHQVTNVANIALTGLSSGSKTRYNSSVGAPIDGLARAAKEWIVPADAKFVSELGGIEVGVAVVDGGGDAWGKEKGRKKARVEAISKQGGIKIDLVSTGFLRTRLMEDRTRCESTDRHADRNESGRCARPSVSNSFE